MKFVDGPAGDKNYKLELYSLGVNIPVAPEIKCYPEEQISWYVDHFDCWIGFVDGEQVSPPLFGLAIYKREIKEEDGKREELLVYAETKWPDGSLETFLRENR